MEKRENVYHGIPTDMPEGRVGLGPSVPRMPIPGPHDDKWLEAVHKRSVSWSEV
jgi:hypothetical protein